ncbi:2,4-dienoyl-CoA reductase [Prauserella marina]|uniref:Mycofactocin system FadH/OYE family oxidoreductase 2 n=1 Tax=Prauserella marina TaxID=530584 RepID=A0A222VLM2_9PSEU|nr:mycofactocin system FadH/OYE family oxidoreductase 2 [Prauserella marina]ASR34611.1 2,4-dienoyl-CoA reductase [Prauserella marina]PWV85753.1 mycofactocin system FadH/OYE family oxidoreductase 2 [Prauserella marina]SDC46477.1 mycofactocin system FadH/OYE family oxidoreductase 2 [Prauserella marina]
MSKWYPHLFSPLRIGPVTLANRIVFSAHLTNYAGGGAGGLPTARHAAYYAARAAGGAGLIITEEHSTHPADRPYEKLIRGHLPEVIEGYRRITDAVHAHGTPIFAQLNHNGGQSSGLYSRLPLVAPSPVPDPVFREVPREATAADIDDIVAGYATVAAHCRRGGFDGVEIQCSQSSIVRGFLAPATNIRTDEYGGSLWNRARLLLRLVAAVREAIGADMALGIRLCGDELVEGGITLPEAIDVAGWAEATGGVDYVNTSIGVATSTLYLIEASMGIPRGYATYISSAIRDTVELPVVGVGRFKDPEQAEKALAEGKADLIGVVRGQIADADFAAKARSGHSGAIRTCLSCNQECVGRVGLNRDLGCVENPRTGKESVPLPPPRRRGRRVVVVGGGPAGLRTAATAASRGHQVTLLERLAATGGQVAIAARAPSRAEFLDLVSTSLTECLREGVDVRTGFTATAESIAALAPEAVVLATGARPRRPHWAGELGRIVDVRDVLEGRAAPEGRVLVVDDLGFHQATSVAELLADRGCAVRMSTPGLVVGQDLALTLDMETFSVRAEAKGIVQDTEEVILSATRDTGGVRLRVLRHTTGATTDACFDWVVCATHQEPEDTLWHELSGSAKFEVVRAGDCVTPRRADAAIAEGHRAAVAL